MPAPPGVLSFPLAARLTEALDALARVPHLHTAGFPFPPGPPPLTLRRPDVLPGIAPDSAPTAGT
jgi:hypothetical protein